jgi:hypothetical protein
MHTTPHASRLGAPVLRREGEGGGGRYPRAARASTGPFLGTHTPTSMSPRNHLVTYPHKLHV